jgi:hypothetical protein
MSYRIDYYTLSICKDGSIGNVKQSTGHVFTDSIIELHQRELDIFLKSKKKVGVINKITDVGGKCITSNNKRLT